MENHKKIQVYVRPGASSTEIAGEFDGCMKIRIKSPAVDGKANQELIEFLAKLYNVKKSSVQILKGHTSNKKMIIVNF